MLARTSGSPGAPRVTEESAEAKRSAADLDAVRSVLVGPEQRRLAELATRLEGFEVAPADLAEVLPEAIALRTGRDQQLGRALAPTVETALRESIRRNPREIAAAIFPVLGPAIRKAIAESLAGLVRSINRAVEHSLSLRGMQWRIESWRTGVPFADIVVMHALVYRVEQVFLIHAETGLLLSHVSAPDLKVPDADLISSMLTAIQDFVRDSFRPGEGATLSTFTVGEHTVHIEAGPRALLAAVIRGQAPESVAQRLQTVLESIHLEFAAPLAEFTGDSAPFARARPLLEDCLETVLSTERDRKRAPLVWLRWAIPVALVAVAAAALALRSGARWDRARQALEDEPGIVLVRASRSWGNWSFRGLRDPLAREPQAVLAAAGLSPRSILGEWESYLSLDSGMVAARARQVLGVPGSASVALKADTLVVAGDAAIDWLAHVRTVALPAGVSQLDVSGVRMELTPEQDSLRRSLEATRVLFAPGSSDLTAASVASLHSVAVAWRRLVEAVGSAGASLQVTLVGRTDPSGSAETNRALAQWRVDAVEAVLASAGVPTATLLESPVATARPLPGDDPEGRARINRSVSFEVTMGPGSVAARRP